MRMNEVHGNTHAPRLISILEIPCSNMSVAADKRVLFHDAQEQIKTEVGVKAKYCSRHAESDLEIRTNTKLFCEERVFISAASPAFLASASLFDESDRFFLRDAGSIGGATAREVCRRAPDEAVRCRVGREGGARVAAERKSVNEREALSFMGGERVGADNEPFLGVCDDRGESSEERTSNTSGIFSTVCCGSSSISSCRCLRAGHTYSMMRRPTLASTWRRIGWKFNSKDS